jgi:hypothetical protein
VLPMFWERQHGTRELHLYNIRSDAGEGHVQYPKGYKALRTVVEFLNATDQTTDLFQIVTKWIDCCYSML